MSDNLNTIDRHPMRLLFVVITVLAFGLPAGAQTPTTDDPPSISLPDPIEPTADPQAAKQIEKALQGDSLTPLPGGALGDVIDIIRKQGSILDGSSLDPRFAEPILMPQPSTDFSSAQTGVSPVKTAEALLRSARMLESLNERPAEQADAHSGLMPLSELVRQMRIQATRLLAKEFPQGLE